MTYEEKIERIFRNKLEFNGQHQNAVEEVKAWLCCEWLWSSMSSEEYCRLKDSVDQIAEKIIVELK